MTDVDKQTGKPFQAVAAMRPAPKPPTSPAARAWTAFCDRLKDAGHLILSQPGAEEDLYQAETLRYFARELRAALDWDLDNADPDFPRFTRNDDSGSGPTGPNLDNNYYFARVRGDASYRVRIDTRTIDDIIIGISNAQWRNYGDFSLGDFQVGADGILEITAAPERVAGNWIAMPADAMRLAIRVYYHDWARDRPPDLTIERIGAEGAPPPPAAADIAERLAAINDYLENNPYGYPLFQLAYADQIPPNVMRPPVAIPGGGGAIQYGITRFRLAPDEALLIESDVPRARYWGFHTYTMPWYSQIDVANRITALNDRQSRIDADGRVRYVVAHADPGVQNWLDTGGYPTGSVFYRWIWSQDAPAPESRVVPLAQVRAHLPADTPAFSVADRRAQLAARRLHLQRRLRA
ncbi:MAG: hypothetical protein AB7Q97_22710 [Gammaproteobacteria bacterium]